MFLFFANLPIQGVIGRKVWLAMKERGIKSLPIYPEYHKISYPATFKIFYNFDGISAYKILKNGEVIKEFIDSLTPIQKIMPDLLDMNDEQYRGMASSDM